MHMYNWTELIVSFCTVHFKKDVGSLEKIQCRERKMLRYLENKIAIRKMRRDLLVWTRGG